MNKRIRFVVSLLLSLVLVASLILPTLAAEWNGSTADPSIGGSSPSAGGYGIKGTWASKPSTILALRFSFYNGDTGETKGTAIDIYKSAYADYMNWNKLNVKYNKMQLRELYNEDALNVGFTTDESNCYVENSGDLGLPGGLPDYTSELADWQTDDNNLNAILQSMEIDDVGSIYDFQTGDYLVVEPIFPVYIDGAWFALTVTEIAVLGSDGDLNGIGDDYEGNRSEGNSGANWKFIADYTNMHFPNSLFLDQAWIDSDGLAILETESVPALAKKTTFDAIINNGYGIGIAFTFEELGERLPTFDVKYNINVTPLSEEITISYLGEELWSDIDTAKKHNYFYTDGRTKQTFTLGNSDDGSEHFYEDALLNASDGGGWYVHRDEYVWSGRWNTKSSGKGISVDWDIDMTAEELAETLGVDLTEEDPSITLYMEWIEKPELTIKYHTNGANIVVSNAGLISETSFVSASNKSKFVYGEYYTDALRNMNLAPDGTIPAGEFYAERDGYTWTGYWNTSEDRSGKRVKWDVDMTAEELAAVLGVDLLEGDQTVDVYMEWFPTPVDPYVLTIRYHTNGADSIVMGGVGAITEEAFTSNGHKSTFVYGTSYTDALRNALSEDYFYVSKTDSTWSGYWTTAANGSDGSRNRVKWDVDMTAEELASALGVDLSEGNQTVDVYMEWSITEEPGGSDNPLAPYTVNHILMDTSGLFPASKPHETETLYGAANTILTLADLAKTYTGFTYSHGSVGSSVVTTTTILEDGSRVINLFYARNKYTVTLNKNTGIEAVNGAGTYYYGETVTIDATLSKGYSWNYWIMTGFGGIYNREHTFTMPASDVAGYAYAKPNTLTVIYNSNGSDSILHKGTVLTEEKFQTDSTDVFTYGKSYTDALLNASDDVEWFVTREGYTWSGYWNTAADNSGIRIKWDVDMTAEDLAEALGTDISTENTTITLYMEWEPIPVDSGLLFVDYDGNGATSGEGWSETIDVNDITKYMLSSDKEAFSRVEEGADGIVTQFKFMGWEIDGEFYEFSEEVPVDKLLAAAESVSGREHDVVTIYARWDEFPVVEAVDRWFTLDEATNGDITLEELLRTGDAVDGEVGDTTDFDAGEGTYTIIDYNADDFTKFTATGSVTVTYIAVDKVGNKVKTIVTIHIVDQDQQVDGSQDSIKQYVRYISGEYYKDANGKFVDNEQGGVNENSVWRIFYEYEKLLTDTFNNKQNPETGEWDTVYQTWIISKDQIEEVKAFVEEYGLGKTQNEDALKEFYKKFYSNVIE